MNNRKAKTVIFSDLDQTVLDEKYQYEKSKRLIAELKVLNVPIVFCSSKTKGEIEFYRKEMDINDPFISENGSAIFVPKGYFPFNFSFTRQTCKYYIIELGADYSTVRNTLKEVSEKSSTKIIGFGDMTVEEIATECGLPNRLARLAKMRRYDEPFRILAVSEKEALNLITKEGFNYTKGGRYFHILGKTSKGKAVAILKDLYEKKFGKLFTFGIGDGPNDLSMFEVVDIPILVTKECNGLEQVLKNVR